MKQIKMCTWHNCQKAPEPPSPYCEQHAVLRALELQEVRAAADMCCEPYRAAIREALKLLRVKPGGMAAKVEAVLREVVP